MHTHREDCIRAFHEAFGQDINAEPTVELLQLRRTLIEEEVKELFADMDSAIEHLKRGEEIPPTLLVNMLKELADVQVVTSGASVALKPLQRLAEAFERVYKSNMSKLDDQGKPLFREDGKVLKGPNYAPPDLSDLIA